MPQKALQQRAMTHVLHINTPKLLVAKCFGDQKKALIRDKHKERSRITHLLPQRTNGFTVKELPLEMGMKIAGLEAF